jgi:hypothetical protein
MTVEIVIVVVKIAKTMRLIKVSMIHFFMVTEFHVVVDSTRYYLLSSSSRGVDEGIITAITDDDNVNVQFEKKMLMTEIRMVKP